LVTDGDITTGDGTGITTGEVTGTITGITTTDQYITHIIATIIIRQTDTHHGNTRTVADLQNITGPILVVILSVKLFLYPIQEPESTMAVTITRPDALLK
jgi:hypothetical protein